MKFMNRSFLTQNVIQITQFNLLILIHYIANGFNWYIFHLNTQNPTSTLALIGKQNVLVIILIYRNKIMYSIPQLLLEMKHIVASVCFPEEQPTKANSLFKKNNISSSNNYRPIFLFKSFWKYLRKLYPKKIFNILK